MWKFVFPHIPIEGLVIDPDVHSLFDGPSDGMYLPAYDGEIIQTDRMSHGLAMLINGGAGSEVFFEPIPNGPSQIPDILLLRFFLGAFVPVDYPTLLISRLLVFGSTNRLWMVLLPLKWTCIPTLLQILLNLLLRPLE